MSVSFHPLMLILLPIAFYLLHRWPKVNVEIIEESRVGIFRRIGAFYVDMGVGIIGVLPFMCMPALIVEYLETAQWVWSFDRDYSRLSDVFSIALMLFGFFGIFYYARWHFVNDKQTLGQHLFGFKLSPMVGKPQFSIRPITALANFSWWPVWPWTIMRRKQDYWWDRTSNKKARRVEVS